jgi:DNA invertase Pin-like site-specific DNA recombinase
MRPTLFANRSTVHSLSAVAEDEARRISERTKAALAAAKARSLGRHAQSRPSPRPATLRQAEGYTRRANQERMASEAMPLLMPRRREQNER